LISLRPSTSQDEPFLRQLYESTREDLLLLPAQIRPSLVDMQFKAQAIHYANTFPNLEEQIILLDESRVGRLITDENEELNLVDISMLPEFRARGIGTEVITRLQALGKPITLTVRRENPARRLYARLGFVETASDQLHSYMKWNKAM